MIFPSFQSHKEQEKRQIVLSVSLAPPFLPISSSPERSLSTAGAEKARSGEHAVDVPPLGGQGPGKTHTAATAGEGGRLAETADVIQNVSLERSNLRGDCARESG